MQRRPEYLTLALFIATLVIFIGGSVFLLQLIKESKEQDLGKRLLAIGNTVSVLLGREELYLPDASVVVDYQQSPDYQQILTLLRNVKVSNNLLNVILLDKEGRVLAEAGVSLSVGAKHPFIEIDDVEIKKSAQGEATTTPYYRWKEEPHKRAYVPVIAPNGTLMYILRLEASRDYFAEIEILKRHLYWVDGIGSFLLGIIVLIFHRLVRRLIRAEEAISRTERLQALGTMAASVAHEIRNPLGIIRASAEELKAELTREKIAALSSEEKESSHCLLLAGDIIEECDRINQEVYNFLQWTQPLESLQTSREETPTTPIVNTIKELAKRVNKIAERASVQVKFELPPTEMKSRIDPLAFRQAMLNLLINAMEATGENGLVQVKAQLGGKKQNSVEIEISDNGKGMSRQILRRAFEPFFTTKRNGTGLGLTISRRIIEQAGGKILIQSRRGKGTTVRINLPLATD